MKYTNYELKLLVDAFKNYVIIASRQIPPEQTEKLAKELGDLLDKITKEQAGESPISKPDGISDEWFDNVCKTCNKFKDGNCTDGITAKYPGKCDPILHYEANKLKS